MPAKIPRVLRRGAVMACCAASAMLSGCAALQIDVDVYKGPLVNNENIQRQQVISMALSAKVLMMSARNRFIEDALNPKPAEAPAGETGPGAPAYKSTAVDPRSGTSATLACAPAQLVPAGEGGMLVPITNGPGATAQQGLHQCQPVVPRAVYARAKECYNTVYSRAFLLDAMPADSTPDQDVQKRMRLAIQLNDLLTFYEKKSDGNYAGPGPVPACAYKGSGANVGIDAGRDEEGIESLANDVLAKSAAAEAKVNDAAAQAEARETNRKMERALADLASRMQFLGTNQWLVENKDQLSERYKALFEAIANTILLHVDDIQNRREFDKRALTASDIERAAFSNGSSKRRNDEKVIDVMDELIAQLRYQYLKALKDRGATPPAKNDAADALAQALQEARRQRALMIYLRPSSSYLRSVFATTYTQQDPGLTWQNLLNDRVKDLAGNTPLLGALMTPGRAKEEREVRQVRADLDKVFWQNINTVRVGGAGSTNFVIAKDDVGNWYVKAMGADPEEMIKAATNTALFSYSGRIDTNLLRINELRSRVDNRRLTDTDRTLARQELETFRNRNSGPAAAAHGNTWALFEDNYRKLGQAQLTEVASVVGAGKLPTELKRRWTEALAPLSVTDRDTLVAIMDHTTADDAMKQAKAAAASTAQDPAEPLLATLEALHRYQRAVQTQLLQEKTLVAPAQKALANAETARLDAERTLEASLREVADAEAELNAVEKVSEPVPAKVAAARSAHQQARNRMSAAAKALAERREGVVNGNNAVAAAIARRDALLADVDNVIGHYVRSEGARRQRANDEMETAARIVGQSVSPDLSKNLSTQ